MSHGMGSGNHAEVDELKARVAELEAQRDLYFAYFRDVTAERDEARAARDNFKAAHELEHTKRREAEIRWKRAAEEWMHTCDKRDQLAGYVRRLREALIAHTPPMFMHEIEALLKETE